MFKIENTLLLTKNIDDLTLKNVIKEFLKETNMLVSNVHLTHVQLAKTIGDLFPLETNKYDGSWYKNLLIAAEIIIDRLHARIDENKDYLKMFNDIHDCDFLAFAKKWNKINFMVKFNLSDEEWERITKAYNIYATSRKLEEIIAKKVGIDLKLLQSLSLELNQYRSVAKRLDEKQQNDYDSFIAEFIPKPIDQPQQMLQAQADGQNQQHQAVPNLVPQPQMQAKTERGPLSPLKKEMDQILRWVKIREEEIKNYKQKMAKGYDVEEYKKILSQLEKVKVELEQTDDAINATKKILPVDPIAREMAQIERWSREQQAAFKKYLKNKNNDYSSKEELKHVESCLTKVQSELLMIEEELKQAKLSVPLDPLAREMAQILNWIKSRQSDIKAYKRQQAGESVNDELKLIEKELEIIHHRSSDISATIDFIHQQRPVDPYKKELDELLRWIASKEKEIRKLKASTSNQERQLKQALLDQIRREIASLDNEIFKTENLLSINEELKDIDHEIANKQQILLNYQPKHEQKPTVEIDEITVEPIKKPVVVKHINDQELLDIAQVYNVEAAVLRTAIEVMPEELAKYGKQALPKMLRHLLDEGYIEVKEGYEFDPQYDTKLRKVEAIKIAK